jgi:hypothetical protein
LKHLLLGIEMPRINLLDSQTESCGNETAQPNLLLKPVVSQGTGTEFPKACQNLASDLQYAPNRKFREEGFEISRIESLNMGGFDYDGIWMNLGVLAATKEEKYAIAFDRLAQSQESKVICPSGRILRLLRSPSSFVFVLPAVHRLTVPFRNEESDSW